MLEVHVELSLKSKIFRYTIMIVQILCKWSILKCLLANFVAYSLKSGDFVLSEGKIIRVLLSIIFELIIFY